MDTRTKIVSLEKIRAFLDYGSWTIVIGLFDPLTASQARRIERLAQEQTLVVVLEQSHTVLAAEIRCQLVASLRSVHYVVQATRNDWSLAAPHHVGITTIDDEEEERHHTQTFIELVAAKQQS